MKYTHDSNDPYVLLFDKENTKEFTLIKFSEIKKGDTFCSVFRDSDICTATTDCVEEVTPTCPQNYVVSAEDVKSLYDIDKTLKKVVPIVFDESWARSEE